jgi:hypothetical protein
MTRLFLNRDCLLNFSGKQRQQEHKPLLPSIIILQNHGQRVPFWAPSTVNYTVNRFAQGLTENYVNRSLKKSVSKAFQPVLLNATRLSSGAALC